MSIRIGVIGVGVHGLHHVRLLSGMDQVELVGIHDIDYSVAARISDEYNTTAYTGLENLLENVDCVAVAVPTTTHFEIVSRCFAAGRHVLIEKPIANTVNEAQTMIEEADRRGLILAVGHIERFNPAYRSIRDSAGTPVFIESHRLAVFNPRGTDVAVVLDLMIHDIDIVLNMVGRPVETVNAVGVAVVSDEIDIANARLEFEGGCVANLTASRISQRKMRKIRTFQRNAYISMDFLTGESEVFTLRPESKPSPAPGAIPQLMDGISYDHYPNDGSNALELELADFVRSVLDGVRPQVTGEDGRRALDVASRVMESMEVSMRRIE